MVNKKSSKAWEPYKKSLNECIGAWSSENVKQMLKEFSTYTLIVEPFAGTSKYSEWPLIPKLIFEIQFGSWHLN